MRVWDLATGREHVTLTGHSGWVWSVTVTPDGTRAVSGSHDRSVRVWDLAAGTAVVRWDGDYPVLGCTALPGHPTKIAVAQRHGPPYMLELRGQEPAADQSRS